MRQISSSDVKVIWELFTAFMRVSAFSSSLFILSFKVNKFQLV